MVLVWIVALMFVGSVAYVVLPRARAKYYRRRLVRAEAPRGIRAFEELLAEQAQRPVRRNRGSGGSR